MAEDCSKLLLEHYGIKAYGWERTRTGLLCHSDTGKRWELKKTDLTADGVRFCAEAKAYLWEHGFQSQGCFCPTTTGELSFFQDGHSYVLEDAPPAEIPAETEEFFLSAAAFLGQFHQCGKGFQSDLAPKREAFLPFYEKKRIELLKIQKRIRKLSTYDGLDLLVLHHTPVYLTRLEQAIERLSSPAAQQALSYHQTTGYLVHRAFKGDHLRLKKDGSLYLTGFFSCALGSPMEDLAALLRRFVKKTERLRIQPQDILDAYEGVYPLSQGERLLLSAMLSFPEKYLKLVNTFYNKRRSCVSTAMQERLLACIQADERQQVLSYLHI